MISIFFPSTSWPHHRKTSRTCVSGLLLILSYLMVLTAIKPLTTDNLIVCGWLIEYAKYITAHVVLVKILKKCFSVTERRGEQMILMGCRQIKRLERVNVIDNQILFSRFHFIFAHSSIVSQNTNNIFSSSIHCKKNLNNVPSFSVINTQ